VDEPVGGNRVGAEDARLLDGGGLRLLHPLEQAPRRRQVPRFSLRRNSCRFRRQLSRRLDRAGR
jgi:hypothetical protein